MSRKPAVATAPSEAAPLESTTPARRGRRPQVNVAETPYGLGVFAIRAYRKNQRVGRIHGNVIDDEDYTSSYCMDLGGTLSLEPGAPFRYLNHSCEPNCALWIVEWPYEGHPAAEPAIVLETLRAIEPGEQLTIDYAWPAHDAIPCGCAAPTCRGYVVAEEEVEEAQEIHGHRNQWLAETAE